MAITSSPDGLLTPLNRKRQQLWGIADAAHLLRRLQFGYTPEELDQAAKVGADETLERLLNPQQESAEFQNAESALKATALATGEINDLKIWWLYRMWASTNPLTEKMSLLWHNHFATSFDKVRSVEQMLNQKKRKG
eukprot:TRINITY_DN40765_c0_g2_i1.p2 TRINITY_DN40765_c0_g2~~TRINITY_DN40765_c0_g2_i1.p2  ORF type:complete len:137 (-),score=19.51 TRINITY_DN40765_c0_g2_i1:13-423(-)